MEDILTLEQQVKDLKTEGLSYRQIAEQLNISLGKVQRILNNGVSIQDKSVSEKPQIVSQYTPNCIDTDKIDDSKEASKESVADLKKQITQCITYKELELLKVNIEELINKRLNYAQKQLNTRLEEVREEIKKSCIGGRNS